MNTINPQHFGLGLMLLTLYGCGLNGGLLTTVGPEYQSWRPPSES